MTTATIAPLEFDQDLQNDVDFQQARSSYR